MFKTKYRVVRDNYLGYECQCKVWYFPIWLQMNKMGWTNTHKTLEEAREFIDKKTIK